MFCGTAGLGPSLDVNKMRVPIRLLQQLHALSNLIAANERIMNPAGSWHGGVAITPKLA